MAVYQLYSHPIFVRYKASLCSKALFFFIFTILLIAIPPIFIAYSSEGLWLKIDSFNEQPDIHYKHALILLLETASSTIAFSDFANFNQLMNSKLRMPLIKFREEDSNFDGRNDALHTHIEVPLLNNEQVHAVKMILIFDYKLYTKSQFQMECLAYLHYSSGLPGSELQILGDLRLRQKRPLTYHGKDFRYNVSLIKRSSIFAEDFDFFNIFKSYTERDVTTYLQVDYPLWISGGFNQNFIIQGVIRYPEETIFFSPGFWQMMKWAWIQYICILLIFMFVVNKIKSYVFQSQFVTTIIDRPIKEHWR